MTGPTTIILYELLTLLIGGFLLVHAALQLISLWNRRANVGPAEWIRDSVWFGIVLFVLGRWPHYSYPYDARTSSFLFVAAIASFSIAFVQNTKSRYAILLKRVTQTALIMGCFIFLYLALRYVFDYRPVFFSQDFFYYINVSRDLLSRSNDLDSSVYFYFPGIYSFWRIALSLTGGSLEALQWASLIVIITNTLLVGTIVFRVTKNFYLSTLGAAWLLLLHSRFDGLLGMAEPIATLPILIGLFCWSGKSLLGRAGFFRMVALGVGFGLGLYVRQHAGFVSLGSVTFLITLLILGKSNSVINFPRLILMPLIAVSVFVIAILFEGHGFQPLIRGLVATQSYTYDLHARFTIALWNFATRIPSITFLSITAFLIWITCLLRFHAVVEQPWFQMLSFSVIGGIFALIPYLGYPALHYVLFSGALFIVASAITIDRMVLWVPQTFKNSSLLYFFLIVLTLIQFVDDQKTRPTLYVWPPEKRMIQPKQRLVFMTPQVVSDLKLIKQSIRPSETIYVLPPSQNDVHFFLNTTYPTYGWLRGIPILKAISVPNLSGVIIVKKEAMLPYEFLTARIQFGQDSANKILQEHGFHPVMDLSSFTLWRKMNRTGDLTATAQTRMPK